MNSRDLQSLAPCIELPSPPSESKKTLFLDLDDTLVRVCELAGTFSNMHVLHSRADFSFRLRTAGFEQRFLVYKRGGLDQFLKFASEYFEVVLYTAATKEYADAVLGAIDPTGTIFAHRLYRNDCVQAGQGRYIKSLKKVANRALNKCILVDDNEDNFSANPGNCLIIEPIDLDEQDTELRDLTFILTKLNLMQDFCGFLRKMAE